MTATILERFTIIIAETGTDCLAPSLMSNHFHLRQGPQATKFAIFMCQFLAGYAIVSNLKRQ